MSISESYCGFISYFLAEFDIGRILTLQTTVSTVAHKPLLSIVTFVTIHVISRDGTKQDLVICKKIRVGVGGCARKHV